MTKKDLLDIFKDLEAWMGFVWKVDISGAMVECLTAYMRRWQPHKSPHGGLWGPEGAIWNKFNFDCKTPNPPSVTALPI